MRRGGMVHDDKLPEWAEDGPATMDELIELRGFDEQPKQSKAGPFI